MDKENGGEVQHINPTGIKRKCLQHNNEIKTV